MINSTFAAMTSVAYGIGVKESDGHGHIYTEALNGLAEAA